MKRHSPLDQRLDTNYVPTSAEIDVINRLLSTEQLSVDAIDAEIAALQQRRRTHTDFMERHRHLLTPARRIPSDIISTIFRTLVAISDTNQSPHPSVTVSHVCHLWRELAINSPLLWANIDITVPPYPSESPAGPREHMRVARWNQKVDRICLRVETFAHRAKDCGIHVSYSALDPSTEILLPWMIHRGGLGGWERTLDPFTRLVGVRTQWKSLSTCLHMVTNVSPLFSLLKLIEGVLPGLDHFGVELLGRYPADGEATIWEETFSTGSIMLDSVPLTSFSARMPYNDLGRVQPNWSTLAKLDLGSPEDTIVFGPVEAATILDVTPNLVHCTIQFSDGLKGTRFTAPQGHAIVLPKLQSFTMRGTEVPIEFASLLDLPSLTHLSAIQSPSYSPLKDENSSAVVELIRRYGEQLTDVSFVFSSITPSAFGLILDQLPNVVSLELVGEDPDPDTPKFNPNPGEAYIPPEVTSLQTDVLRKLIDGLGSAEGQPLLDNSCVCPRLRVLTCTLGAQRDKDQDRMLKQNIISLVRSRRRRGPKGSAHEEAIAWLMRADVVFKGGPVAWMVDRLRSDGVDVHDIRFSAQYASLRDIPTFGSVGMNIPGVGSVVRSVPMPSINFSL